MHSSKRGGGADESPVGEKEELESHDKHFGEREAQAGTDGLSCKGASSSKHQHSATLEKSLGGGRLGGGPRNTKMPGIFVFMQMRRVTRARSLNFWNQPSKNADTKREVHENSRAEG